MDRSGSSSSLDSAPVANPRSLAPKSSGLKRSSSEVGARLDTSSKRVKTRDLESVFRSESTKTISTEPVKIKDDPALVHGGKNDESSPDIEAQCLLSDKHEKLTKSQNDLPHLGPTTCLRLGKNDGDQCTTDPNITLQPSNNLGCCAAFSHAEDAGQPSVSQNPNNGLDLNVTTSLDFGVDLNAENPCNMVDQQNPFYPYKSLHRVKSGVPSECGSSTGPLEETEPWKLWKQMKQNGFLSNSHGGIPLPKQRSQSRKSKVDPYKKKIELAKREQVNRFTKIAAPSGLLSGLNPGIINHVRNSKQVHSIIEALVRSEKQDGCNQNKSINQLRRASKDMEDRLDLNDTSTLSSSEHICVADQSHVGERSNYCEPSATPFFTSESIDDALTLKLSSVVATRSDNASAESSEDFSPNQESLNSLSIKAANVASQWLELLYQDLTGRLTALRRSRKRVQATITAEFPSWVSHGFLSSQENNPGGCSSNGTSDMHVARWRALFDQMDKSLHEEGKHLRGLQFINISSADGFQQLGISEKDARSRKLETLERECAVRAAAASIYSTCNLVTAAENVSCF
ncbi:hypothetical protein ACLOJK_012217 [Asimina triloba]